MIHLRFNINFNIDFIFSFSSETLQNMQCMVMSPQGTLYMGGHHNNLIELDLSTLEEINIFQVSGDNCAILRKHPRFICSGDISGKVCPYYYCYSNYVFCLPI